MFLSVWVSSEDVAWWKSTGVRGIMGESLEPPGEGPTSLCPHLVQEDDPGFLQDGASDCHALLLPSAELQTALPHLGVVS